MFHCCSGNKYQNYKVVQGRPEHLFTQNTHMSDSPNHYTFWRYWPSVLTHIFRHWRKTLMWVRWREVPWLCNQFITPGSSLSSVLNYWAFRCSFVGPNKW
jgi:hypothetical protein